MDNNAQNAFQELQNYIRNAIIAQTGSPIPDSHIDHIIKNFNDDVQIGYLLFKEGMVTVRAIRNKAEYEKILTVDRIIGVNKSSLVRVLSGDIKFGERVWKSSGLGLKEDSTTPPIYDSTEISAVYIALLRIARQQSRNLNIVYIYVPTN